jgi:hypothetical protein
MDTIKTIMAGCRSWRNAKQITAVAAYEDTLTDARVTEFCRGLSRQLGDDCEVVKQMWLLNELRIPQLRSIAAGEASRADLIIVSVHHAPKLPDEITHWIEQWLRQKQRQAIVLLALFDSVYQGDSASMRTYLAQAAKKAAMQFLVHSEEEIEDL